MVDKNGTEQAEVDTICRLRLWSEVEQFQGDAARSFHSTVGTGNGCSWRRQETLRFSGLGGNVANRFYVSKKIFSSQIYKVKMFNKMLWVATTFYQVEGTASDVFPGPSQRVIHKKKWPRDWVQTISKVHFTTSLKQTIKYKTMGTTAHMLKINWRKKNWWTMLTDGFLNLSWKWYIWIGDNPDAMCGPGAPL